MSSFLAATMLLIASTGISTGAPHCRISIVRWTETRYVDVMSGASGIDREPVYAAACSVSPQPNPPKAVLF
jgi:hypothetical protein